jgi:hypothetical protein
MGGLPLSDLAGQFACEWDVHLCMTTVGCRHVRTTTFLGYFSNMLVVLLSLLCVCVNVNLTGKFLPFQSSRTEQQQPKKTIHPPSPITTTARQVKPITSHQPGNAPGLKQMKRALTHTLGR